MRVKHYSGKSVFSYIIIFTVGVAMALCQTHEVYLEVTGLVFKF